MRISKRVALFASTLLLGIVLAGLGVGLSAPIGPTSSPVYSNPRVEYAPLMFVVGITLMFASAVVYELVPDKWEK